MASLTIAHIILSARQRHLIREHGCPFEELSQQLERLADDGRVAVVSIDSFYLDHLIANLIRSAKEIGDEALLEELDELLSDLEIEEKRWTRVGGQGG